MGPRTSAELAGLSKTSPVAAKQYSEDDLDLAWQDWHTSKQHPEMFGKLMKAADPVINKAMTSYAPNASPSVRSKAKILTRQAAMTFDPKKGVKFRTYLYTQLQPLMREVTTYDTLHVPERVRMDLSSLNNKNNEFVAEHGYEPSEDELSDYTGLSRRRIEHLRKYDRAQVSEQQLQPRGEDDPRSLPAVSGDDSMWEDYVYDGLGEIDKRIYDLKTGKRGSQRPLSVSEIANKLRMTPSAVSQRMKRVSDMIAEGSQYE